MQSAKMRATLARLASDGADAEHIADAARSIWSDVDAALSPIIGQRGVAALYKRSLELTRADYPCLVAAYAAGSEHDAFVALQAALAEQDSSDAAAASDALLQTFCNLLTTLIGASLTERLLQPVWDKHTSGDAARGTSHG